MIKILDAQGRLFGKINVIDFLALMFLVSLTPMFYFGYKIFNKKPQAPQAPQAQESPSTPKTFLETEVDLTFTKLDSQTAKLISRGDKELDTSGQVIGEIISVGKLKPLMYEIDLGSGLKSTKEDSALKQIPVTLRIKAEVKDNSLYYKDKPVKVNSLIDFRSDKYAAQAIFIPLGFPPAEGRNDTFGIDTMNAAIEQKTALLNQEINLLKNKVALLETLSKQEKTTTKKELKPKK